MRNDIRFQTVLIIRKGNEFLTGRNPLTGALIWRPDYSDAWRTRVQANARSVAEKVNGEIYLFNPIVGEMRKYDGSKTAETVL